MPSSNLRSLNPRVHLRAWCLLLLLLCATAVPFAFPLTSQAALTDGLVGHWTFDGADTETTIADRSGNNNFGYVYNGATSTMKTIGKLGQAMRFNGLDNGPSIIASTPVAVGSAMSFAFWMKDEGTANSVAPISWSPFRRCNRTVSGGDLWLGCDAVGGSDNVLSTTDVFDGQWHHVVYTVVDDVISSLYIDGILEDTATEDIDTTLGAFEVGARGFSDTRYKGIVDDARFYNRALTASEVKQLYLRGQALKRPPNNLGLVGYWSFNEGTGTIATDFSGNGNTGTFSTAGSAIPTWTNGKRGKAVTIASSDQSYVTTASGNSLTIPGSHTVSAWVKPSAIPGSGELGTVAEKFRDSDSSNNYLLGLDNGVLSGGLGWSIYNDSSCHAKFATTPALNEWHHLVGVYDSTGATYTLYVNGVQQAQGTSCPVPPTGTGPLWIGRDPIVGSRWNGPIDEVRIYNRALGGTEVAKLYGSGAVKLNASSADLDNGSPLESGLVGHWTFDGPDVTTTVTDRSGQNNHGYFVGGATSSAKVIGKLGQALQFDGSGARVEVTQNSGLPLYSTNTAYSVSGWVKGAAQVGPVIFNERNSAGNAEFSIVAQSGGQGNKLEVIIINDAGSILIDGVSNGIALDGTWHHVVWTDNNGTTKLYIDSIEDSQSFDYTRSGAFTLNRTNIGALDTGGFAFSGTIDDARVYNRALSAKEVNQLYNLGTTKVVQ